MKSHRLGIDGMGSQPEQEVGKDTSNLSDGVSHIVNHPVPRMKPVIKEGVGPFIANNIQGPESWHGEEPTTSASATHDQYLQAEHMATVTHDVDVPRYYPDPVPVIIVPNDSGHNDITIGRANRLNVDISAGPAIEIVPKDVHRSRVTIRNEHATIGVRIGGSKEEASNGFLLTAGDARDFHQQTALYAWPADGIAVIPISFMAEYSRGV